MSIEPIDRLEKEVLKLEEEVAFWKERYFRISAMWDRLHETCKRWEKMWEERDDRQTRSL
jgi:hypothetical protein